MLLATNCPTWGNLVTEETNKANVNEDNSKTIWNLALEASFCISWIPMELSSEKNTRLAEVRIGEKS
jgi:hypothetical protein